MIARAQEAWEESMVRRLEELREELRPRDPHIVAARSGGDDMPTSKTGSNLQAIKRYFDCSFDELKELDSADKAELGPLCIQALAEDSPVSKR